MLKTNSKKVKESVRAYILDGFTPENYTDNPPKEFNEIATFILNTFRKEKYNCKEDYRYYKSNEYNAFLDWCSGLPSVLDTCYYYNRSAVEDLGNIFEQTEEEKAHYTEQQAEERLTMLIYRELKRGAEEQ